MRTERRGVERTMKGCGGCVVAITCGVEGGEGRASVRSRCNSSSRGCLWRSSVRSVVCARSVRRGCCCVCGRWWGHDIRHNSKSEAEARRRRCIRDSGEEEQVRRMTTRRRVRRRLCEWIRADTSITDGASIGGFCARPVYGVHVPAVDNRVAGTPPRSSLFVSARRRNHHQRQQRRLPLWFLYRYQDQHQHRPLQHPPPKPKPKSKHLKKKKK